MRRRVHSPLLLLLSALALMVGLLGAVPAATSAPPGAAPGGGDDHLDVYVLDLNADQIPALIELGVDRQELSFAPVDDEGGDKSQVRVEAILSGAQAAKLQRDGLEIRTKKINGLTAAEQSTQAQAEGDGVFRQYSGPGGLKQEFKKLARQNKKLSKLVTIGETVQGQEIVALKVSKNARKLKDGKKPTVLYLSAQHAREWITPEMTRRLATHVLDQYGSARSVTRLVNKHELWFVPVANPDGYDFTFTPDNRLWRKNLRDNNGDGEVAPGDGVDLNRNYATRWGYDNEGSSPSPSSETYRGPGRNSEPESKALHKFVRRVDPEFLVNYHSAAELLLYGTGWQVATPSPDDTIYEAMAGDDADPAIEGYDPDISAELYTTNGDTDTHMTEKFGALGFTPEMSTCETVSDSVPDDEWVAEDCESGFNFPDDEGLIQEEFERNLPFALSVAKSAGDPDDPKSVVGRDTPNFVVDDFDVSYGDPQPVSVIAKRSLRDRTLKYKINGGKARTGNLSRWQGGEKYGAENDEYYAEYRGTVRGTAPGDTVRVWFTGRAGKGKRGRGPTVRSESFSYDVEGDSGADVLVVANEDYTGVNPTYPEGTDAPKYAAAHQQAIEDAGYSSEVWDVDARGVPHHLGVLGHYDAVVWYLGDNRLTQDPEDEEITTPFGELEDIAVAERQQYLTLAVRDYLNEGGKLVHAGETAQYQGMPGISDAVGGPYYGLNGAPDQECVVASQAGFFEDCLILADDFRQYYLGAFTRTDTADPSGLTGVLDPLTGYDGTFGGPVVAGDNPLDEAGVLQPTSDALPPAQFPQFASEGAAEYATDGQDPFAPVEGTQYAGALHQDSSYMRLTKTVDLTGATAAELAFQLSISTEESYDNVIVEAHTVGQDDWVTLPSAAASAVATQTEPPAECEAGGFLLALHPFLGTYLGGADCTEGEWNSFTGSTDGWQEAVFDLSGYAGGQVEVSISYVTDPSSGGVGAFVDDTRVTVDGAVDADGFEEPTSSWTPSPAPAGSPPNAGDWQIAEKLVNAFAAISTEDSLMLGFGFEQLDSDESRAELMERALDGLL